MLLGVEVKAICYGEEDVFPSILVVRYEEDEEENVIPIYAVYHLNFDTNEIEELENFEDEKEARRWCRENGFKVRRVRQ